MKHKLLTLVTDVERPALLIQLDSHYMHIHAQLKLSYGQGYSDSIQTERYCSTPVEFIMF
jgi:hypothetical protein